MTTATPQGADVATPKARHSRIDMLNYIEQKRVGEINGELKDAGSGEKIEFTPTPDVMGTDPDKDPGEALADKASGADTQAGGQDEDPDERAEREREAAEERAREALEAKQREQGSDLYELLGEDKLDKTKVRVKVDGQVQEVVLSDALRDVQKLRAADKRLEEAGAVRRKAEEDAATIRAKAEEEAAAIRATARDGGARDPDKKTEGQPSGKDAALDEGIALMYEGHQKEAADKIRTGVTATVRAELESSGLALDDAAIDRKVDEKLRRREQETAWNETYSRFSAANPEIATRIATDPDEKEMFEKRCRRIAEQGVSNYDALMSEVAGLYGATYEPRASEGGHKVTADASALNKREEEKRKRDSVRPSTSTRASSPRADESPAQGNPSAAIAELQKWRGQA